MTIWIHDTTTLIATSHGFAWTEGETYDLVRMPRDGLRRDQEPPSLVGFGVLDPKGESALFRAYEKPLSIVQRGKGIRPCDARGNDVVALCRSASGALVAAVREEGSDVVSLARVSVANDTLSLDARIPLGVPPRISPVPAWFVVGGASPWRTEERAASGKSEPLVLDVLSKKVGAYLRGNVRLFANAYGVGVSSTYNGLCAVLDPETLAPRLLVRVPSEQEQFDLFVCPLSEGALITAVANYRHTLFMRVDEQGKASASRDSLGWGASTHALALSPKRVLIGQDTDGRLYTLALPTLKEALFDTDELGMIDHGGSDDGAHHVIARVARSYYSPHHWTLERLDSEGKKTPLPSIDFRPPAPPEYVPSASAETGPATIGVSADPATPWTVRVGESAIVRMKAVNTGGPAKGLWVEVGGPAVTSGMVRPEYGQFAASSERASFAPRAILPTSALPAFVSGEAARIAVIEIALHGLKPGKAIFTVRVGAVAPAGPQSSGSGMCGRTLEVVAR